MDDAEAFNEFIANTKDDLFADDDEDDYLNEEYYNRDQTSTNVDEYLRKKNAKYGPFTTATFWSRTDNAKYDLKNHLWDFMVYNNIREHSCNNYRSKVEVMRSELVVNIVNCEKDLLDHQSCQNLQDLPSDEIETCFYNLVSDLLEIYGVKLNKSDFMPENVSETEVSREVEQYVGSHMSVIQLDRQIREYKKRKMELVKSSLFELLKSFNEFRNKILEEVYQDSKAGKMDLTRFVKNMDKVTSRFDFFGEYRFHNIRTYYKNKEELDNFVENYVAFNNFTSDFTQFVNTFNPNYSSSHMTTTSKTDTGNESKVPSHDMGGSSTSRSTEVDDVGGNREPYSMPEEPTEDDINEIFDYLGGMQSQNYVETQEVERETVEKEQGEHVDATEQKRAEEPEKTAEATEEMEVDEEESENLKLLEEARKKAAEILR
ncbi:Conserved hypothetical protein [Theileria orientalis strain Shintoku]|uniref:Uncharacterized protein n=1 Tax=Theileria orientalis strain Shintoku TaxID=869250 RepID=J4C8T2_THEOR|nr:Conserved hypothetical protein [Theileria orientalis strain Shintoku]BAM41333.1 Conserved hypothetical protein [Theileria orientalis strain Shintoku]|eukprot:XP_009691634.1 Conserved hypothetical protein [Theileria orientalis strain Shintoku]